MGPGEQKCSSTDTNNSQKIESAKLKRKKPVIEDSDNDDLDFGGEFTNKPAVKKKLSLKFSSSKTVCTDSKSQNGQVVYGMDCNRQVDDRVDCIRQEDERVNCVDSGSDSDVIMEKSGSNRLTSKAITIDSDSE